MFYFTLIMLFSPKVFCSIFEKNESYYCDQLHCQLIISFLASIVSIFEITVFLLVFLYSVKRYLLPTIGPSQF